MRLDVTVTGTRELKAKLAHLSDAIKQGALERATMAGAMVIENRAKEIVPVRTGNLRRSIHSEIESTTANQAVARVGTNVEYGPYVEFGTRRMSARPFLRPALDEKGPEAQAVIGDSFRELIRQATR